MRHVNTHVTRSRTSLFVLKISGFHVKLSTRNRVHSPADSLGRLTPRAHALKGVLLNSAPPDACEPPAVFCTTTGMSKISFGIHSQNAVHYTPSSPQKQDGSETFTHARHPESTAPYRIAFTAMLPYIQEGTSLHFQPSDPWYAK